MEDFHLVTQINNDLILTGVLDGHGGPEVAKYVSNIMAK
jgi:serine/threonine protein phosphatase PrpC